MDIQWWRGATLTGRTWVRRWGFTAGLLLMAGGCCTVLEPDEVRRLEARATAAIVVDEVRAALRPLDLDPGREPTPPEREYLRTYRLDIPGTTHRFGTVPSGEYSLAVHVISPRRARGSVLLLHGYYDHTGTHGPTVADLVAAGFTVVAFDLPGLGLSSGARATIADFADYREALRSVLEAVDGRIPAPLSFVGHSTGCAVAIDLLLTDGTSPFEHVVLTAPLVRSPYWSVADVGAAVAGWFADTVPRRYTDSSSDPAYSEFRDRDPLQHDRFPLQWFEALEAWEERIRTQEPVAATVLVLQGDEDRVVDHAHNVPFVESRFSEVRVVRFPGARHQLWCEVPEIRERVIGTIVAHLSDEGASPR